MQLSNPAAPIVGQPQEDASASLVAAGPRVEEGVTNISGVAPSKGGIDALRQRGREAVLCGDLASAQQLYEAALAIARVTDNPAISDLLICNLAAVKIELGAAADVLPELRGVLMRTADMEVACLAAYQLARNFELEKGFKKALFYAQMARDRAEEADRAEYRASALNLLGNVLLAESREPEAIEAYETALELMPLEEEARRAHILDNLGYCRALQGRLPEAFELLYRSLRTLRRYGADRWLISTHLDLCFAHLEASRLNYARRHGERALTLALTPAGEVRLGTDDDHRNALYLLGEVAMMQGDMASGESYFARLQSRFFPESENTVPLLMAVGARNLVNLRA
jgi:tetratricopeptide (TPR) repeat protein